MGCSLLDGEEMVGWGCVLKDTASRWHREDFPPSCQLSGLATHRDCHLGKAIRNSLPKGAIRGAFRQSFHDLSGDQHLGLNQDSKNKNKTQPCHSLWMWNLL